MVPFLHPSLALDNKETGYLLLTSGLAFQAQILVIGEEGLVGSYTVAASHCQGVDPWVTLRMDFWASASMPGLMKTMKNITRHMENSPASDGARHRSRLKKDLATS